ncbi:MAG TPA: hypothetical protein VGU72_25600 [Beijerinckiaceae bacterium]|jgi:hypothetical protein|nr:hypothetical protein [Beijerinckiaceae bacterium]
MTDTVSMLVLILIAVASTSIAFYVRYARKELRRLREYDYHSSRFFEAVQKLAEDDGTPERLLFALAYINEVICDRKEARRFFAGYEQFLEHQIEAGVKPAGDPEFAHFMKTRSELAECAETAMFSGLLALTFLGNGWGQRARALLADSFGRERKPTTVLKVIEDRRSDVHEGHLAPVY